MKHHPDGVTAVTTQVVNIASANGVHFCTAMGNSGHDADPGVSHFIAPADAFHVISCGAVDNAVPGIDGDCGGQCACGTCHVFVSQEWANKTGTQTAAELEMLDFAAASLGKAPSEMAAPEWLAEKQRMFGRDWPNVQRLLDGLRLYGIHFPDVHLGNIRVRK